MLNTLKQLWQILTPRQTKIITRVRTCDDHGTDRSSWCRVHYAIFGGIVESKIIESNVLLKTLYDFFLAMHLNNLLCIWACSPSHRNNFNVR